MFWFMLFLFSTRDSYLEKDPNETGLLNVKMMFAPLIWGFLIPVSDLIYSKIAHSLNSWENWKRESAYEKNRIIKVMSFRFMNSFLALYYYAFADLGIIRLSSTLFSFLIGGQISQHLMSIFLPWAHSKYKVWRSNQTLTTRKRKRKFISHELGLSSPSSGNGHDGKDMYVNTKAIHTALTQTPNTERHRLSQAWLESTLPLYENFDDYASIMIQFGYVTLFGVAFPLAPLCALVNNLIQMRIGAYRLCEMKKRPVSRRSSGIGIWLTVLKLITFLAIFTNSALIGFTSHQVDLWFSGVSLTFKIIAIFVFEHTVFALVLIVSWLIPSVPHKIRKQLRRDKRLHVLLHHRERGIDEAVPGESLVHFNESQVVTVI